MLDTPENSTSTTMDQHPRQNLYGKEINSRLLLGTAGYPSPDILSKAIIAAKSDIVTLSLRRETAGHKTGEKFFDLIKQLDLKILPNTAGCQTVQEAVTTAQMARELFGTDWIKVEITGNADTLQPDLVALIEATRILSSDGFKVFPYTTEDLTIADRLLEAGAEVIMPWGSPIGSGRGLANPYGLKSLRAYFPDTPLIIDAGIGAPSHAAHAMELGYDAILLNTAVAKSDDPIAMAQAFATAIEAGHIAYKAGIMDPRDMAEPSTPVAGTPFSF